MDTPASSSVSLELGFSSPLIREHNTHDPADASHARTRDHWISLLAGHERPNLRSPQMRRSRRGSVPTDDTSISPQLHRATTLHTQQGSGPGSELLLAKVAAQAVSAETDLAHLEAEDGADPRAVEEIEGFYMTLVNRLMDDPIPSTPATERGSRISRLGRELLLFAEYLASITSSEGDVALEGSTTRHQRLDKETSSKLQRIVAAFDGDIAQSAERWQGTRWFIDSLSSAARQLMPENSRPTVPTASSADRKALQGGLSHEEASVVFALLRSELLAPRLLTHAAVAGLVCTAFDPLLVLYPILLSDAWQAGLVVFIGNGMLTAVNALHICLDLLRFDVDAELLAAVCSPVKSARRRASVAIDLLLDAFPHLLPITIDGLLGIEDTTAAVAAVDGLCRLGPESVGLLASRLATPQHHSTTVSTLKLATPDRRQRLLRLLMDHMHDMSHGVARDTFRCCCALYNRGAVPLAKADTITLIRSTLSFVTETPPSSPLQAEALCLLLILPNVASVSSSHSDVSDRLSAMLNNLMDLDDQSRYRESLSRIQSVDVSMSDAHEDDASEIREEEADNSSPSSSSSRHHVVVLLLRHVLDDALTPLKALMTSHLNVASDLRVSQNMVALFRRLQDSRGASALASLTQQAVASTNVTRGLSASMQGYLPVDAVVAMLKERSFVRFGVNPIRWLETQVQAVSDTQPVHPALVPCVQCAAVMAVEPLGSALCGMEHPPSATERPHLLNVTTLPSFDVTILSELLEQVAQRPIAAALALFYILTFEEAHAFRSLRGGMPRIPTGSNAVVPMPPRLPDTLRDVAASRAILRAMNLQPDLFSALRPPLAAQIRTRFSAVWALDPRISISTGTRQHDEDNATNTLANRPPRLLQSMSGLLAAIAQLARDQHVDPSMLGPLYENASSDVLGNVTNSSKDFAPAEVAALGNTFDEYVEATATLLAIHPSLVYETLLPVLVKKSARLHVQPGAALVQCTSDPLLLLRCPLMVFCSGELLRIVIMLLEHALGAGQDDVALLTLREPGFPAGARPVGQPARSSSTQELPADAQDQVDEYLLTLRVTACQALAECCLDTLPEELIARSHDLGVRQQPDQVMSLTSLATLRHAQLPVIRRVACSFLERQFQADVRVLKCVHTQGYDVSLVPILAQHIPGIHACLADVLELLTPSFTEGVESLRASGLAASFQSSEADLRSFAVHVIAQISLRYPMPHTLDAARRAVGAIAEASSQLLGAQDTGEQFLLAALPALVDLVTAFPRLIEPVTAVLLKLRRNVSSVLTGPTSSFRHILQELDELACETHDECLSRVIESSLVL